MKQPPAHKPSPANHRPIFDAHLDLAWNAVSFNRDLTLDLDSLRESEAGMSDHPCRGRATVTFPELRRAGVRACVGTLLARSGPTQNPKRNLHRSDLDYANSHIAHAHANAQLSYYHALAEDGQIELIHTAEQLKNLWAAPRNPATTGPAVGVILSMEGADPMIRPESVQAWHDRGLRIVGPVHYGQGRYAAGTGIEGPLTELGVSLINQMQRCSMILDVTHLADQGLEQALDLFGGPVIASHHNCRALVPGDRQLSDKHIAKLIRRGGMIGVALDAWMLYPRWHRGATSPGVVSIRAVADHIDHICQIAGDTTHVGIGSDLDGGFGTEQTPHDLQSIAHIQKLIPILESRGYDTQHIDAIFSKNWLSFFLRHLPKNQKKMDSKHT